MPGRGQHQLAVAVDSATARSPNDGLVSWPKCILSDLLALFLPPLSRSGFPNAAGIVCVSAFVRSFSHGFVIAVFGSWQLPNFRFFALDYFLLSIHCV